MSTNDEIAILDFGSQYTHLIARRVRELGVVSHIYATDVKAAKLNHAAGIILSGGPRSVVREKELPYDKKIFSLGSPILGLCYGHQLMAKIFGGSVGSGRAREYGLAKITVKNSPIFKGIPNSTTVWMSHGDHVAKLPPGFAQIATSHTESIAAMADVTKKMYGFQFHPEVTHSRHGKQMLHNFIFDICGVTKNWTTTQMLRNIKTSIKQQAGTKNVFLLVSGGVDSTVCFALLEKVLGKKRVYGLHIDSGFMRAYETKQITSALKNIGFNNLHIYNAESEFFTALKGITEPEQKRTIIGNLFLDITDRIMKEKKMSGPNWLLGQGTIYPDTIESGGTKHADVIKTHHNRVPRVQAMIAAGRIIEPLKDLYKDEVRTIGLKLGLPKALIYRHPFPGPGLAIRCLCSKGSKDKVQSLPLLSKEEPFRFLKLPVKSVGVQGDERSYAHPGVLVSPQKNYHTLPIKTLRSLSPITTNTHKDLNRVLWFLAGDATKLTQSIIKPATPSKKRITLLQTIDAVVNAVALKDKRCKTIWQLPVVLIPFGYKYGESIVLRPVESEEAMTVSFGEIPNDLLKTIAKKIAALKAIDFIFYDVTNKPPGTIEWE